MLPGLDESDRDGYLLSVIARTIWVMYFGSGVPELLLQLRRGDFENMLIETILGNIGDFSVGSREVDKVYVEWYELEKKLLRKTSEAGEEVGIRLTRQSDGHLHEGDVLFADGKKVMIVDILPCDLTVVPVHSMQEMGRLCFELGNRHLTLSIEENQVKVPFDAPTFAYLEKLGFAPRKEHTKFHHFTVCHAHGHAHGGHSHE